jgi:hypothetical protein
MKLFHHEFHYSIVHVAESSQIQYEEVYRGILNGTKGATKTKCLAAQLIPRYFKYFPKLSDESLNALMDLCEEEDTQVMNSHFHSIKLNGFQTRILAVRAFPIICKDTPSAISKGADILGQLLQTGTLYYCNYNAISNISSDLQLELDNVKHCLVALLKIDVKCKSHSFTETMFSILLLCN